MYSDWIVVVVLVNLFWLCMVTFLVWKHQQSLKKITSHPAAEAKGIHKSIQKMALHRYNPYHDTGGDQSFSLALLDAVGDGVVITSLHSRAGTRVFAKKVTQGKEDESRFSGEERQVIEQALT